MKRCTLFCAGLWPFILLPLLLLLLLLFFKWQPIERDVAKNTQEALLASGMSWAKVETTNRGREVLITGTPPNQASIDRARETAKNAYGVNSVTISSDVAPPAIPAELSASIGARAVTIAGLLGSQEEADRIVLQAEKAFSPKEIINKLVVNSEIAALPKLDGFFTKLESNAYESEPITASLTGQDINLRGTGKNDQSTSSLIDHLENELGFDVSNNLEIAPQPIKLNVCQDLINDLLSSSKINFASGKAKIQESSFDLLQRVKSTAERCQNASFEVSGHTDNTGSLSFNMALSEQRAQSVIDYLAESGLDSSRFTAAGYGPTKPIADNLTQDGRAQNRRIEFTLKN